MALLEGRIVALQSLLKGLVLEEDVCGGEESVDEESVGASMSKEE